MVAEIKIAGIVNPVKVDGLKKILARYLPTNGDAEEVKDPKSCRFDDRYYYVFVGIHRTLHIAGSRIEYVMMVDNG